MALISSLALVLQLKTPAQAPPADLTFGGFFTKMKSARGIPVLGSSKVDDEAMVRQARLLEDMTARVRPEVLKLLVQAGCTFSIIAEEEGQTDLPQYAFLRNDPQTDWNKRARGLGGQHCSAGEENILELPSDRYRGESISVHEFAHTLHDFGFAKADKGFQPRLDKAYQRAKAAGLWTKTYALTNASEYFAEGVQSYFDCNLSASPPNGIHNEICNREGLRRYDPELFALIDKAFGRNPWRYQGGYRTTGRRVVMPDDFSAPSASRGPSLSSMTAAGTLAALSLSGAAWTLAAGGDIMLNGIPATTQAFAGIQSAFQAADVAYANLEIPLTDKRTPTRFKTSAEVKARSQFILKADPRHIDQLAEAGFDLLSLANNHGMDYGWGGLKQTMDLLDSKGIAHSGGGATRAEAEAPAVKVLPNGFKVGMISALAFVGSGALNKCGPAGESSPGIAVFRFEGAMNKAAKAELARRIGSAKAKCDFLIVAPHWGVEKQTRPREWQMTLGRALIDAGADAVIGAHPHVLQGREVYRGKPILYSTSNLVSSRPGEGAVYTLTFERAKLASWSVRPFRIIGGRAQWHPASQAKARLDRVLALDRLIPKP